MCSKETGALITTGGGFSDYYSTPSWQAAAVSSYLSSGAVTPGPGNFTRTGRGYPDVAAISHRIVIWINGSFFSYVDGTSASAPIFAAILALANSALYAQGLPPVGLVNPTLYAIALTTPAAYNDVNCPGCVNNRSSAAWCVGIACACCPSAFTGSARTVLVAKRTARASARLLDGMQLRDGALREYQHSLPPSSTSVRYALTTFHGLYAMAHHGSMALRSATQTAPPLPHMRERVVIAWKVGIPPCRRSSYHRR